MDDTPGQPPVLSAPRSALERPAAAGRVAVALLVFGVCDLAHSAVSVIEAFRAINRGAGESIHLSLPAGIAVLWFAAWLVWRGNRVIWPIMAYVAALSLGAILGSALGAVTCLPIKLLRAYAASGDWWLTLEAAYYSVLTVFFVWLLWESNRVAWRPKGSTSLSRWLKPGAILAYGGAVCLAGTMGFFSLMTGPWTKPIIERARTKIDGNYDYYVRNYHFNITNGHGTYRATVIAYSETELNWVQLHWED